MKHDILGFPMSTEVFDEYKKLCELEKTLTENDIPCELVPGREYPVLFLPSVENWSFYIKNNNKSTFKLFSFDGIGIESCVQTELEILNNSLILDLKNKKNKLSIETETQKKISDITDAMKDLLLYKNQKYGDSAINPKKIFYKGDSTNSILIRLDDKLGRIISNTEDKPRVNDCCDLIGYLTLLLISLGVTPEDIAKFKD